MSEAAVSLCLVAALDRRNAIGLNGQLPWHLPDDLKRFKAITLGKPLLMGRKTAAAIGRPLPGRVNIVLSRSTVAPFSGVLVASSLQQAFALTDAAELMVIGGGEIYAMCLPLATRMVLTHVDTQVEEADAFFPPFNPAQWQIVDRQSHPADARHPHPFTIVDYRRPRTA